MAMINCTECGRAVSDKATACPGCGNPIAAAVAAPAPLSVATKPGDAVTTEATGKTHKVVQIVGAAIMCVSMVSCVSGAENLGMAGFILGAAVYFTGQATAWWSHG